MHGDQKGQLWAQEAEEMCNGPLTRAGGNKSHSRLLLLLLLLQVLDGLVTLSLQNLLLSVKLNSCLIEGLACRYGASLHVSCTHRILKSGQPNNIAKPGY
jgi:hypothetical protein